MVFNILRHCLWHKGLQPSLPLVWRKRRTLLHALANGGCADGTDMVGIRQTSWQV